MSGGGVIAASQQAYSVCSRPCNQSITRQKSAVFWREHLSFSSNLKLVSIGPHKFRGINLRSVGCRSTGDSGENESRTILDAFFLGKALAETLNERIESSVGEFLSIVGRLQAEQQKQLQEFQDEVLEKAKRAKEQAAREAMETQGTVSKFSAADVSGVNDGVVTTSSSYTPKIDSSLKPSTEDPVLRMFKDD
ncbi:hypothetical protein F511_21320 [Dorcoceras hygrometricum]|uniref:Uncharacterized protein n=1 Tax=Dorcoceras hygrometricum TaxID=472368 RepID=A0A2Z7DDB1_9LAMI|nr:hypothetical protein F511_21320 [Dorcoceras hygrometricum]